MVLKGLLLQAKDAKAIEVNGPEGTITLGKKDGDTKVVLNAEKGSVTANTGTLPFSSLDVTENPSLSIDVADPAAVGIPFPSTGAPNVPILAVTLPSEAFNLTLVSPSLSPSVIVPLHHHFYLFFPSPAETTP